MSGKTRKQAAPEELKEYTDFIMEKTETLLNIDSPTGYTEEAAAWVKEMFAQLGFEAKLTNKGGVLVSLGGKDVAGFFQGLGRFPRKQGDRLQVAVDPCSDEVVGGKIADLLQDVRGDVGDDYEAGGVVRQEMRPPRQGGCGGGTILHLHFLPAESAGEEERSQKGEEART